MHSAGFIERLITYVRTYASVNKNFWPLLYAVCRSTVYCKLFEVEKFRGFRGIVGNHETFPVK